MNSKKEIQPDYRIVRMEQQSMCDQEWLAEKGVESCGVYYLIDFNLHVHICSLTPNLEAFPMNGFAVYKTPEQAEADQGDVELEMMASEHPCSYFGTEVERLPNKPATNYMDVPAQEEGEADMQYRLRVAEAYREYFCGNPAGF